MEDFEGYRPLLFSIAYRMTGSASEAEDIVQEAYLRYQATDMSKIRSLKPYLSTIVTHLSLDYLKSARVEREQYVGTWLPEPVLTTTSELIPLETIEQRESISLAFLILLETLTPPERAVFLLHEVFDYPFQEIAEIIDKSPTNCRQIFHRAKHSIEERRQRFDPSPERQQQLITGFLAASQSGDLPALMGMLAQDVTSWSDGGGKAQAALNPIHGQNAVARYWMGIVRKNQRILSLSTQEVNGSTTLLLSVEGTLIAAITLAATDKGVQGVYAILNPDKLAYIQRQLAAQRNAPHH